MLCHDAAARTSAEVRLCLIIIPPEITHQISLLRYTDSWHHGWKCRQAEKKKDFENQKRYYKLMLKEDADAALLRVFECFLEAAPQLVLQFTIIMRETKDKPFELGILNKIC